GASLPFPRRADAVARHTPRPTTPKSPAAPPHRALPSSTIPFPRHSPDCILRDKEWIQEPKRAPPDDKHNLSPAVSPTAWEYRAHLRARKRRASPIVANRPNSNHPTPVHHAPLRPKYWQVPCQ